MEHACSIPLLANTFAISVLKDRHAGFNMHTSLWRIHAEEQDLTHSTVELLEHTPSSSRRPNHHPAAPVHPTVHWNTDTTRLF